MKPIRIQRRRTKGWRTPDNTIYCGRPGEYGNRYVVGKKIEHVDGTTSLVRDRFHAVRLHREWLDWQMDQFKTMRAGLQHDLGGRNLSCWCSLDGPCHVDNLLRVANP